MFSQFKTLAQLFDYFKDEETCLEYWIQVRWSGNVTCPHCGAEKPYKTNRGYKCRNVECQKKFSPLVKSIFENTKVPIRSWFAAIYLVTTHKKGVSSLQLSRDLGIHQKSAWYMLHRIREAFREEDPEPLGGEGVVVETDVTVVGGKTKNMHKSKRRSFRQNHTAAFDNKTMITGYIERGGPIRFEVIQGNETEKTLARKHIDRASILMTDTANVYRALGDEYARHETVNHMIQEYVRDKVWHTNTIEGAFSHFDRMVMGVYHYVSRKHMQAYANECAFRYNTRKIDVSVRFGNAIRNFSGKRLLYNKLTA
jgi:transposase-like protein